MWADGHGLGVASATWQQPNLSHPQFPSLRSTCHLQRKRIRTFSRRHPQPTHNTITQPARHPLMTLAMPGCDLPASTHTTMHQNKPTPAAPSAGSGALAHMVAAAACPARAQGVPRAAAPPPMLRRRRGITAASAAMAASTFFDCGMEHGDEQGDNNNDVFGLDALQGALAHAVEAAASATVAAQADADNAWQQAAPPSLTAAMRQRSFSLPCDGRPVLAPTSDTSRSGPAGSALKHAGGAESPASVSVSPCVTRRRKRPSLAERRTSCSSSLSISLPSRHVHNTEDTRPDSWSSDSLDNLFTLGAKYGSDVSLHLDPAAQPSPSDSRSPLAMAVAETCRSL